MAVHKEPLNGGLNTSLDPGLLPEGQMPYIRNAYYRPGSQALQRARGRAASVTISATAADVNGLRDVTFDNGDHYLISMASANLFYSTVATTASATALTTITPGNQLERVHYRNRFYLMNGAANTQDSIGTNVVTYLSATAAGTPLSVRQHGMKPVKGMVSPTATAAGVFSQTVTGYYEYWVTEVAKLKQDGADLLIESTFQGDPSTFFVSSTGIVPVITFPHIENPTMTTHWRVYRSPKKEKESDKEFPIGFSVAGDGIATAATSFSDTQTVTTSTYVFPASFNNIGIYASFASASSMGADDAAFASGTTLAVSNPSYSAKRQGVYNFPFSGITGAIKGLEVRLKGYSAAAPVPISVTVGAARGADGLYSGQLAVYNVSTHRWSVLGGNTATKTASITSTSSGSPTTIVLGGPNDRWFPSDQFGFLDSDFDANFMVVVSVSKSLTSIGIGSVEVRVSYAAASDGLVPFPAVVYTFGDVVSEVGKNGTPPSSSTGDLYQDSLVVNDVSNPSLVRYSYPGDPEAFPETYYIDFETADNDQVQLIKTVNNRLIVGLTNSIWRMNYLPSERDASFDRGKAIEPISSTFGCVNPMCAARFSPDGSQQLMAFVSLKGIHCTDGFSFVTLTDDLAWRQVISIVGTSVPIALINDPENRDLILYYRNDDLTPETYLALHFSYAVSHIGEGGHLKISGPVNLRNYDVPTSAYADLKSAWPVTRTNGDTSIYLGYGGSATAAGAGKVYLETGTSIPANDSNMAWITRRMYLNDMGNEYTADTIYGYCGSYTDSPTVTYTALSSKTDQAEVTGQSVSRMLGGERLHRMQFRQNTEGMRVSAVVASASDYAQEFMLIEARDLGKEAGP